ncbi:hypothetical protein BC937DRAFT_92617 [Endogone sp. FLAS-F59071]|nr:hypothetical protein BC937DRAFT_92617 [Endogone sp. FLAS-F59071]|eukprot:RUS15311.1 hypothetical protein BC937DRAFT_92617 [Endogone sp. FLAS-F59071]
MIRWVKSKRCSRQPVRYEIDPQQLHRDERLRHPKDNRKEDRNDLSNVRGNEISDELLSVVVDGAPLLDGFLYSCKVVIGQDHICCELGHVRARAHCNTNVSHLEGRRVVDTVTSLICGGDGISQA